MLRSKGLLSVVYLDDFLCIGNSYKSCKSNVQTTIKLLESLGFIISYNKSSTTPSKRCKYLGFVLDSKKYQVEITNEKELNKRLERAKWLALLINNKNFEGFMLLKEDVFEDIRWWKDNIMLASSRIKSHNYKLVVTSDASRTGWGAESSGVVTQGFWSTQDQKFHINYLELLAAFFALKCFASKLYDCEILLRIDNTTAIAYINKAALNVDADAASRVRNLDTEWELSPVAFQKILKVLGSPSIDLFASRINKKCVRFCSRYPDPDAESVDAFTVSWSKEYFYAFPPFALVLPSLRKIINDEAVGIVVAPLWKAQPWYPLFTSLLSEPPLIFKPSLSLLLSPSRQELHTLATKLSLV
ncbi:GSCOCG00005806001-RA-CDS, partial [Cotesia congregata]